MAAVTLPWIQTSAEGALRLSVDLGVYPLEAVLRTCYLFTDRCYLFLAPEEEGGAIRVEFSAKSPSADLSAVAGEFGNELLNQRLRLEIARETRPIRELIVAQAFAEADLIEPAVSAADYRDDPKGILK